jgi:energy-coupling factor transport system ATP-binding protein
VQNLSVRHVDAAAPAPHDVSFEVHAGEVVLVLGPSGSGKSTLTLALNGLIPQSVEAELTGTVEVAGRDTRTTPVAQLSTDISMVFQDPDSQLFTGTVLDEVAFALENLLLPASEVLGRAERALRQVGLWGRRTWNPDLLSGGGRQRLAIACALAMRSRVIVLDEPTANLDPQGVADVYQALSELTGSADRAIVLVEHNLDAALGFATRVIVLDRDGRMLFDGPARQTLDDNAQRLQELGVWLPSEMLASPDRQPRSSELPPAKQPVITVRDLVVRKGRETVLRIPELDIPAGSFTAIVGANGSGKTTLLQALGGVVPPARGTVMIGELDAAHATPRRLASQVGFVFQNPEHQFIAHTVRDELAHGLLLQRVDPHEVDARVDEMLDRFGLRYRADEHPFLLSGGEKRRLSVGTALIARPRVVALDEPTFGQDRSRAAELLDLLQELQESGTTVVIVTHDLNLVGEYATHTVVLGEGAVLAAGRTAEVLDRALAPSSTRSGGSADVAPAPAGTWSEHPSEKTPMGPHPTPPSGDTRGGDAGRGGVVTEPTPVDPYAEVPASARLWLHHLNPLSKIAAVLPAIALLVVTRDLITPAIFLVLAYLLVLSGARITRRSAALLVGMPAGIAVLTVGFSIWVDPAQVAGTGAVLRIGDWELYRGALMIGLATVLRLAAILALALIGGLTTSGPDLERAAVQQLRLPYRIGYTALAAYRFVPRFGYELAVIRAAHRVRGHGFGGLFGGRGPISRLVRGWGYIVPLLASGIRHAERVALSMDARAFGAHPARTERHVTPFRMRDVVFVVVVIVASALIFAATFPWQPS